MKKVLMLILLTVLCLGFAACGGGEEAATVTVEDAIAALEENGWELNEEQQPIFSMIGAVDGFWLEKEGVTKTVIYLYEDKKTIESMQESFEAMADWPVKGLLVLETTSDEAKEIFENL